MKNGPYYFKIYLRRMHKKDFKFAPNSLIYNEMQKNYISNSKTACVLKHRKSKKILGVFISKNAYYKHIKKLERT